MAYNVSTLLSNGITLPLAIEDIEITEQDENDDDDTNETDDSI